jgi:hypothetical protein
MFVGTSGPTSGRLEGEHGHTRCERPGVVPEKLRFPQRRLTMVPWTKTGAALDDTATRSTIAADTAKPVPRRNRGAENDTRIIVSFGAFAS